MVPQSAVSDVGGDREEILSNNTIRCMILEREEETATKRNSSLSHGMIIDDACGKKWLEESVQATRRSLPLNHKRPTVDRRFYCDTTREVICKPLEEIVLHCLQNICRGVDEEKDKTDFVVYCNKYLRFLEYKTIGGELLPHRDGTKTCEDTGTKSTHTLLLFLSDCESGGETLIMDDESDEGKNNWSKEQNLFLDTYETTNTGKIFNKRRLRYTTKHYHEFEPNSLKKGFQTKLFRLADASIRSSEDVRGDEEMELLPPPRHVSIGIQPAIGRILLFPHQWAHAGAMCKSVPKIALRAELTISGA